MRVTITNVADFHRLAVPAYSELVAVAGTGRPRLDVEFAPGIYSGNGLTLGEPPVGQAIDIDLHAADPALPPCLVDVTLALYGRQVRLADLLFETASDARPLLRITVENTLEIDHCAFIANRTGVRAGDRLLEFVARGSTQPAQATVRASWFIRNYAPENSTLMAFEARPPDAFGQILLQDIAFLTNPAHCCVAPGGAAAVDVQRCVVLESPLSPGDGLPAEQVVAPGPPFMAVTSVDTRVDFSDSLVVRRSLEGFVSRWSAKHPSPAEYPPVTIRDSRLLLDEPLPPGVNPDGYILERSPIEAAGGMLEHLPTTVDALASEARRGARPRLSELAVQLVPQ